MMQLLATPDPRVPTARLMRRPARAARTLLLLAATLAAGCQSPEARRYGLSRVLDLVDVLPVSVGAGIGLAAEIRATPVVGIGLGYADDWRAGTDELRFGPLWWEEERGIPLYRYYRFQDYEDRLARIPGGIPELPDHHRYRASSAVFVPGFPQDSLFWFPLFPPYYLPASWTWTDWTAMELLNVEAGVFLGVVGIRVGVAPLQALDFVVGLFTLDMAGDDVRRDVAPRWPEPDVAPPSFPPDSATVADLERH